MFQKLFESQVEKTPGHISVMFDDKKLTFEELNQKSNQLARFLRRRGVKPDVVVGTIGTRNIEMLIGIIAIFKAGGAYLPIDPNYPEDRIRFILDNSGVNIVLSQKDYVDKITKGIDIVNTNEFEFIDDNSNLDFVNSPGDLAYVIYTSGTTGEPKGAMIEHAGMFNQLCAKVNDLQASDKSIIAQNASQCFDISVWQFLAALIVGGIVVIYSDSLILNPFKFVNKVAEDKITILEVVPSYLSAILNVCNKKEKAFQTLEYLVVTGETLAPKLAQRTFDFFPHLRLVNAYGPTEASDDITHYIMDANTDLQSIPIGKPLKNLNIYIVDDSHQLCSVGDSGEIWVSGIGVGRGYINNIKKTQNSFMIDPFIRDKNVRLYKTGDLGWFRQDGNIEFIGRKDNQVKIRGYRIELEEVEAQMYKHQEIRKACVCSKKSLENGNYLCAYYEAENDLDIEELKSLLSRYLPHYMIPSYFIRFDQFPLTDNGKIDRNKLSDINDHLETENVDRVEKSNGSDDIEIKIKELVNKNIENQVSLDEIDKDSNLKSLGINSLSFVKLIVDIENEFDIEVEDDYLVIEKLSSLSLLNEYIKSRICICANS